MQRYFLLCFVGPALTVSSCNVEYVKQHKRSKRVYETLLYNLVVKASAKHTLKRNPQVFETEENHKEKPNRIGTTLQAHTRTIDLTCLLFPLALDQSGFPLNPREQSMVLSPQKFVAKEEKKREKRKKMHSNCPDYTSD